MMEYADGTIITDYNGGIKLGRKHLNTGPGLMNMADRIELAPAVLSTLAIQIIREELKEVTLDLQSLNKMLEGSTEDRNVAYELLGAQTKYTAVLLKALKDNDQWTLQYEIDRYTRNNIKLSLEIL